MLPPATLERAMAHLGALSALTMFAQRILFWLIPALGPQPRIERVETYASTESTGDGVLTRARVIFRNVPRRAASTATARRVSARLLYFDEDGSRLNPPEIFARWHPAGAGNSDHDLGPEIVDLDPDVLGYEITLAEKHHESRSSIMVNSTQLRGERLAITTTPVKRGPGDCFVLVWLMGLNVDERRWFRIRNNDADPGFLVQPIDEPTWGVLRRSRPQIDGAHRRRAGRFR